MEETMRQKSISGTSKTSFVLMSITAESISNLLATNKYWQVLVQNVNKTKSYEIENDNDNNQNDSHDKILNKKPAGCFRGEQ